jgi:hypothetical protein
MRFRSFEDRRPQHTPGALPLVKKAIRATLKSFPKPKKLQSKLLRVRPGDGLLTVGMNPCVFRVVPSSAVDSDADRPAVLLIS